MTLDGSSLVYKGSPWGGAGEPAWYQTDSRVRNCRVFVASDNDMMTLINGGVQQILQQSEGKSDAEREAIANAIADTVTLEEPPKELPEVHRAAISCYARGTTVSTSRTLFMHSAYVQTGELIAESCQLLLADRQKAVGFAPAVRAFGHRELLDVLVGQGLVAPLAD